MRPGWGDIALAGGVGLVALAVSADGTLNAALVVIAAAALAWRRVWPTLTVAVTGLIVVLLASHGFETTIVPWATWIALYSCIAHGTDRDRIAGSLLAAAGVAGYLLVAPDGADPLVIAGVGVSTLAAALAGEAVRSRHAFAAEQQKAILLEERARLARELHDAVGHAVNVMVMQAGVAGRVYDSRPEFGREALQTIAATGRDALAELDTLLGLLGSPPGLAPPGPSLAALSVMIQRVRDGGRDVEEVVDGPVSLVPQRVGRAAYRVVQEALTNAAKHTMRGRIQVAVSAGEERLVVEVRDEGGDPGPVVPGRGLVSMAERTRMVGGSFEAGPAGGGFRVRATFPLAGGEL